MIIAIIPARGGSKGIPKKNIAPLAGKPLIAWSLESALKAELVDKVFVTTDCSEIAEVSKKYGAEVVKRPAELASDTSSSESALTHCLEYLNITNLEYVVFIQCTSPLLSPEDIDNAIRHTKEKKFDMTFSGYEEHFIGRWKNENGKILPINHDPRHRKMRQEMQPDIIENGAIYVIKPEVLKSGSRYGGNIGVYFMPWKRSFQIDTLQEFSIVEKLIRKYTLGYDFTDLELILLDFDGTMTDNLVILSEDGIESVRCNRSDGLGINILKNIGIEVVCLTSEKNKVVKSRCDKLGINVISSTDKKRAAKKLFKEKNIPPEKTLFIGNDLNDIPVLKMVKYPVVVNNANEKTKNIAKIVLSKNGGEGAVLELAELIQNNRKNTKTFSSTK